MTPNEYKSLWTNLSSELSTALTWVRDRLVASPELTNQFLVAEVSLEENADEFFALLLVSTKDDVPLLALQATLVANDDDNGTFDGVNVKFELDDVQEQKNLLSYAPGNFTPEVYVTDLDVLKERVAGVDLDSFGAGLLQFLQNHQNSKK